MSATALPDQLSDAARSFASEPKQLLIVPGANHFFDRHLGALSETLSQALSGLAEGVPS